MRKLNLQLTTENRKTSVFKEIPAQIPLSTSSKNLNSFCQHSAMSQTTPPLLQVLWTIYCWILLVLSKILLDVPLNSILFKIFEVPVTGRTEIFLIRSIFYFLDVFLNALCLFAYSI